MYYVVHAKLSKHVRTVGKRFPQKKVNLMPGEKEINETLIYIN